MQNNCVKLRATIVIEYEADPTMYSDGCIVTPEEMAAIDSSNMKDLQDIATVFAGESVNINIIPV